MPTTETAPRDDSSGLSSSRADFASSLQRRLDTVNAALSEFEQQPSSPERRDNFLRRVHALRASARVLGFAAAAEVLSRAEQQIRTCPTDSPADDIAGVRKQLELLPNLVLRGAYSVAPPSPPSVRPKSLAPLLSEPLAIVLWGSTDLVDHIRSIERSTNCLEVFIVEDPDALRSTCAAVGPDVLLLDANRGSITLLVTDLAQAPETSAIPIVVVNVPDVAADGLKELGARIVLPMHAGEHQISQALFQVRHSVQATPPAPNPIGDVSLSELAEHLAREIRQGLVDSVTPTAQSERVAFGDGTAIRAALWSALAQIREQIVDASAGRIQFASGPEGAEPIAPRSLPTARNRALVGTVDLTGRRILVADDDPAVAWFVGGTLRAAGAVVTEVHDGAQALQLAYRIWPEFIVTDILMPGLDGFALCHALKRDVLLRDLPILLLSWKEDLLFRLRDLGADADGYLRKEASASTIVRRVKELLLPRSALERRLAIDQETRGRLDGTTTRQLLEIAAALNRPVRIALRDACALYDLRLRHGTVIAATRTRHDGVVEQGEPALGPLLGITAARFSLITDRETCEPMFSGSLVDVLQPHALRARAAQNLLSGIKLGSVERLTLAPDAFGTQLPPLPLSLRPLAEELLRGTAPRKLLASGAAPSQLLEGLLSDLARRGAVLSIEDEQGQDLLEHELQLLRDAPPVQPPKPAAQQAPRFSFQLPPAALDRDLGDTSEALSPSDKLQDAPTGEARTRRQDTPEAESRTWPDSLPTATEDTQSRPGGNEPREGDAANGSSALAPKHAAIAAEAPATRSLATLQGSAEGRPVRADSSITEAASLEPSREAAASTAAAPPERSDDVEKGSTAKADTSPERSFDTGKASTEKPATLILSSAPLAYTPVTSLIPKQVAVTSRPPPSDDFDWALELSWDATPSPAVSTLPPPGIVEDTRDPASRFVRHPSASPLDALNPPETPELAVVVGRAATETTPSAGVFLGLVPKPASVPSAGARRQEGALGTEHAEHVAPVQLTARKRGSVATSPASDPDAASSAAASPARGESAASGTSPGHSLEQPAQFSTESSSRPASAAIKEPSDPDDERQPTFDLQKSPGPLRVSQTATDSIAGQKEQSPAAAAGVFRPAMQSREAPAAQTRHEPNLIESPIALPVVNQPPRPKDEAPHDGAPGSQQSAHRTVEVSGTTDPVFPLISTTTPQPHAVASSVVIQPTVEPQDGPQNSKLAPTAAAATNPIPTRDTLRSPSSAESESAISLVPIPMPPMRPKVGEGPAPEAALSVSGNQLQDSSARGAETSLPTRTRTADPTPADPGSANGDVHAQRAAETGFVGANGSSDRRTSASKTTEAPDLGAPRTLISTSERAEDRTRPKGARGVTKSTAPITVSGSRQVGWLQALGLATLAGIVTFAATVPIASWVHRRHERGLAPPQTLSAANPELAIAQATSALGADSPPVATEPTAKDAAVSAASSGSGGIEAPTQEEIPVPANVVLKPGEGVVEILTGGDHAVFVDDAFVGRGPLRVVPVNAGRHIVRTRLNGNERSDPIDIGAGRALRLSLEQAWK